MSSIESIFDELPCLTSKVLVLASAAPGFSIIIEFVPVVNGASHHYNIILYHICMTNIRNNGNNELITMLSLIEF